jgi:hypothetical protein
MIVRIFSGISHTASIWSCEPKAFHSSVPGFTGKVYASSVIGVLCSLAHPEKAIAINKRLNIAAVNLTNWFTLI